MNFYNSAGVEKATINYAEVNNKLTTTCSNLVFDTGKQRVIMDNNAGQMTISTDDQQFRLQRNDTVGTLQTQMAIEAAGNVRIGTFGLNGTPTLTFQTSNANTGSISLSQTGGYMAVQAQNSNTLLLESDGGNVNIATTMPDTNLALSVNGATAGITLNDTAGVGAVNINAGPGEILLATDNNNLTLNGSSGDTTWGAGGLATLNIGGGITLNTPNFSADTNGNGYAAIGDLQGNNNFTRMIINDSAGSIEFHAPFGDVITTAGNTAFITVAGVRNINCVNGGNKLGVLTGYDDANAALIPMDCNKLEQIGTNNAYVSMTSYRQDITLTVDPAISLAYETDDFIWRYSGQFAPSGLTSESRYCGATRVQVDVSLVSRAFGADVVWWVELRDLTGSVDYQPIDFKDERYGYVSPTATNPATSEINQSVSFTTVFDLSTGGTIPTDGNICRFRLLAWSSASSTQLANVSMVVRPLRNGAQIQ